MKTHRIAIAKFLKLRDELTIQNIRWELWPVLLILPLSVIMGDLRYFDLEMKIAGFESYELFLFSLGLGCLVTAFIPKRLIIPALRIATVLSALLLLLEFLFPANIHRFPVLMVFHFFNGICEVCAFSLFCFKLNNVERLSVMILIQFYFSFLYTICRAFPEVQTAVIKWGGIAVMAICLVAVFACNNRRHEILSDTGLLTSSQSRLADGEAGAVFVISLGVISYIISCMINYVEWAEDSVSSMAFGLGSFASIILIIIIQLLNKRSALYSWLLFLALSLFGLGALMFDSPVTRLSGSFAYGLGEGLGYIIIFYLIGGAINKSKSLEMFRLYCVVSFVEYFFISGALSLTFERFGLPNHYLAFGVILVLCSVCFLLMPLMQKKLFEKDWADGIILTDIPQYAQAAEEVRQFEAGIGTDFSTREKEVFALLLKNFTLRQIGLELHISLNTVKTHYKNIYRKLAINSRGDLLLKFGGKQD
ncbi:MAG: helix-turn-helix transcriptional regulator [Treponema sp.]|jgi:DNA-binding CsgD family transcriptional regulator|nr:helix-turn-helix transcriptional regulator [Treponema sp.]